LLTRLSIIAGTFRSLILDRYSKTLFIGLSQLNNSSHLKYIYHNQIQLP